MRQTHQPATVLLLHMHQPRPWRSAQYRVTQLRELAQYHAHSQARFLRDPREWNLGFGALRLLLRPGRQENYGQRRRLPVSRFFDRLTHCAAAACTSANSSTTGIDLDVGVPAFAATADSGTSGLVSG